MSEQMHKCMSYTFQNVSENHRQTRDQKKEKEDKQKKLS